MKGRKKKEELRVECVLVSGSELGDGYALAGHFDSKRQGQ